MNIKKFIFELNLITIEKENIEVIKFLLNQPILSVLVSKMKNFFAF